MLGRGFFRISAAAAFAVTLIAAASAPLECARADPDWSLTKSANPTTYSAVGQTINYTYVIQDNTGNFGPGTINSIGDDKIGVVSCPTFTVPRLGSVTCTGSYTITAADITAGAVSNTVTVNADKCNDGCNIVLTAQASIAFIPAPSWTLSKTPNPTTYTGAGEVVNYGYLLTNTGNVTINAISIADNKVAPVSCPSATLASGASMTCTGSYTTTAADVTAGSVTNTATATGTPAAGVLGPATAQATITYRVTVGSITIVKTATGGDATFNFTSSVAGAASFALTTAGGTANRVFAGLTAGTYTFTETSLPADWNLTALACVGGTSTVNLGGKTVSVVLGGGGAVVCTFTNAFNVDAHSTRTSGVIARFLAHRDAFLIEGPDRARFLRRVPGSLWGDDVSGMAASTMPFSFSGSTADINSQINFATSLTQIVQASAYAEAKARSANPLAGGSKPRPNPVPPEPGVDVWMEAHYSQFGSNVGNVSSSGNFGILYLGADYLATPSILVGALVQFDWMKETSSTLTSMVNGRGTMAGPYVSVRLTPNLFFDTRAAWGLSANKVNPFGTYEDSFSTDRWLAHARLTGNWHWGNFRLTPSVAVDYVQERQRSYTDSLGVVIPGQTVSLGRVSFGPEIARRFIASDGTAYEPLVSLVGQWDFDNPQFPSLAGPPVKGESLHAMVQAGLMARSRAGMSMRLVGTYDGIGSTSFHAYGAQLWLNVPLN